MNPAQKILIIDDELQIRRLLRAALERATYKVVEAADAGEALAAVVREKPDVVLLDLGLPDRDGLELIPLIRERSGATLLVVSARDATDQKVAALDLGADDYVTKPFDTEEVLARVRTSLRHRLTRESDRTRVRTGDVEIDLEERKIFRAGEEIRLTAKEFAFVAELARHPGRAITHAHLLRTVWGPAHEHQLEYVRVIVRNIRQKLEADPAQPRVITNDPGIGYRLAI